MHSTLRPTLSWPLIPLLCGGLLGCPPPPPADAGPPVDAGDHPPADAGDDDAGLADAGDPLCSEANPDRILTGDAVVTSAASLIALAETECILGDLIVELTLIDNLTLPGLAQVGGTVRIESNARLGYLQLGALKRVGGDLLIVDNPALANLSGLPLLTRIDGSLVIGGELSFYGNAQLQNLSGLENIGRLGGDLVVGNNNALNSLAGFTLGEVGGSVRVLESPALTSLSELHTLAVTGGDVELRTLPQVQNLGGLEALRDVGGDLRVGGQEASAGNAALNSIEQLATLERVGDMLVVGHNPLLSVCQANALAQRLANAGGVGGTFIDGNGPCVDAGP